MAERIQQLKTKIANSKRKISNFVRFVDGYVAERDFPSLEKRMQDIDKELAEFSNQYVELEMLLNDPSLAETCTEYEEMYYTAYGKATSFMREASPQVSSLNDASIIQGGIRESPLSVLGFHDLFKSLVDDDNNIPDIEKLYHLKGCLKDEAAEVIASIEMSSENYRVAWGLLKKRYDNRKVIRQTHVKVQKHVRALEALNEPVDHWDTLLIEIIKQKLFMSLIEKWEEASCESTMPTFKEFLTFLQRRAQLEEAKPQSIIKSVAPSEIKPNTRSKYRPQHAFVSSTSKLACPHCTGQHQIYRCETFKQLSPTKRFEEAKKQALCINCLRSNHRSIDCTAPPCRICHKRHNFLLHFDKKPDNHQESESVPNQAVINLQAQVSSEGLLATAIVELVNAQGKTITCRAFLDAGSQANFVTERVASLLNLDRKLVNISISGVENITTDINHSVSATVKSRFSKYSKRLDFLVLNRITRAMPSIPVDRTKFEIPRNIILADPEFYKSSEVDLLIGVKLFYKLLCVGQITLKNLSDVVLQKTQLGWIVAGEINGSSLQTRLQCFCTSSTPSDANLTRFWELEEIPLKRVLSSEEQACENHFKDSIQRNSKGRYVVRLPFNNNKKNLGESRSIALRRFYFLEKKFQRDPALKEKYCEFLAEYHKLNDMSLAEPNDAKNNFYFPHHAVMRADSITTKIRVVFDGSAKTSSGTSLNDSLMVGPTIQDDLFSILNRFRSHRYALTADIEKMYRQILVHPDDAAYQRILFRKNPEENIREFTLNTVTYGTSCAPFLAIRTLHQLASDERAQHPMAATVLTRDFYVDDLLTGANTIQEAIALRDELIALLQKGGFPLRKWNSNDRSLIPETEISSNSHLSLDPNNAVKTLGIHWNSHKDVIFYKVTLPESSRVVTKRSILSQVAKLFVPLGLLGPVIVRAKIIIQLLWKAGVSWDETIPTGIHTVWVQFKEQLPCLEEISFDRLIVTPNSNEIQMHGFCDASERAYGACIYLRSTNAKGQCRISLICSKSRVAPVKSCTLPRLELCAALLLARLYSATERALQLKLHKVYFWSDSTITLHWINTEPHLLKTFVSNRITEIQTSSKHCEWRHVPTQDNPADLISRGQTPQEFVDSKIWKTGPEWLSREEQFWPTKFKIYLNEVPEKHTIVVSSACVNLNPRDDRIVKNHGSFKMLKRVFGYVLRFIHNSKHNIEKRTGPLTASEIDTAKDKIILIAQSVAFFKEIQSLRNEGRIPNKSRLTSLKPFLDNSGVLRVGGRLRNSELPEEQKHQMLLPPDHHITRLIIREEHERLKHAGPQATLYSVREHFWPLDGRNVTRKIVYNCVRCFRAKPRGVEYVMGDLPQERVSYSRPFLNVGVDYCGPLYIKEKRFRNQNKIKVYVAIFVCMATKAVHLELSSDLTTEAFIGCLKRLFSRRGIAKTIQSDNATNFVGASRELIELYELFQSKQHKETVQGFLTDQKITWTFIPPRSPHFGGLWEAAVKSFKHHLMRTVGDTLLTFEQLETYVIEIEAILNSRPLSPMSSDPNDMQPLTPGHFLIGGPLTSFPQMNFETTGSNRLSAWQHAQKLRQHFWRRWHKEYLHQLTVRSKWQSNPCDNIQLGTLVVIKEDNLPPLQWKLGRIVAVHPGPDGVNRVATVKTDKGEYKRCIKKLCPLPVE
ncbi:uncharacterized protein LOC143431095 [Xylocopa sonorina]|uniref:uncharacterized protein LOC143431095 n=1 Tax=Xylocopa sonorina TaxID=1818115 RepID=UPI00403A7F13